MRVGRVRNAMLLPSSQWDKEERVFVSIPCPSHAFFKGKVFVLGGYSGRQVPEGPVFQVQMVHQQLLNLCP